MKALLLAFVAGSALALQAADSSRDLYVSINGTMLDRYSNLIENVSTDLAAVLKTASNGDTVWVEDGYVWEGVMDGTAAYCRNALTCSQAVTLRSVSGVYDEAKDLGVTIRGQWHEPGVKRLGPNAVRCLYTSGAMTLRGIIFEGGSTESSNEYRGGGAIYFNAGGTVYNCLFRDCMSCHGGAVKGSGTNVALVDCVFTNCTSSNSGGAVYVASAIRCVFADNSAANLGGAYNGAASACVVSNCSFVANHSTAYSSSAGGGAVNGGNLTVWNCGFTNNTCLSYGGAVMCSGGMYSNCTFVGNSAIGRDAYGQGGALKGGATLIECRFYDNISSNNGCAAAGGAVYGAIAKDCTFSGNATFGNGGAAIESMLTDCTVDGNAALYGGESAGRGGGLCYCTATNCMIVNNWTTRTHGYGGRGGGAYDSALVYCTISNNVASGNGGGCYQPDANRELVRCLFVGNSDGLNNANTAGGVTGVAGDEPTLVHCTLTGNGRCGVNHVRLSDCISWGNGQDDANIVSAVRSCSSVLTDEMGEGNVTEDPKLRTKPAGYVYWPANSKCYNMGRYDAYAIGLMLLLR